jgi:hypothetical protein
MNRTEKIKQIKHLANKKKVPTFDLWNQHTKDEQKFLIYIKKKINTGTKKKLGQGNISLDEFKAIITEDDRKQIDAIYHRVKYPN